MANTVRVRLAEPKDVVNIFRLLQQGWIEQTVEYAPVNDLRGFSWILGMIASGVVAVADYNGRIVGACGAGPFQPPWSMSWLLDVEAFYVIGSFRKEGLDAALLRAVEGWADAKQMSVILSIHSGDKPEVKDRMMGMNGWKYTGGNFIRSYNGQKQTDQHDREQAIAVS